jgi:hypothetical protein
VPYKYITYKNGFTEIIPFNLTSNEEAAQMARMNGVKSFPSANYRSNPNSTTPKKQAKPEIPPRLGGQ